MNQYFENRIKSISDNEDAESLHTEEQDGHPKYY